MPPDDTKDRLTPADDPSGSPQADDAPSSAKVELDIDDAPFLEQPKSEPQPAPEPEDNVGKEPPETVAAASKASARTKSLLADRKKVVILGASLLLLLLIVPLSLMLLRGTSDPDQALHEPERIIVPGVPIREDAPAGPGFLYRLGGFFVERRGSEGEIRFLRCSFSIPMDNQALFAELQAKDVVVRDAIYYYLRNKPLTFLADKDSREMLKVDLMSIINEQVSSEKVLELYFEEYLVTGT